MAEPAAPLTVSEVDELIQRMQHATKLWRPLLVAALVLVVAGFAVLAGFLEYKRRSAEDTVRTQAAQIEDLNATLASSRIIIDRGLARNGADSDWQALSQLIGIADSTVVSLNETLEQPAPASAPTAAPSVAGSAPVVLASASLSVLPDLTTDAAPEPAVPGPALVRLFLHIQDERQRPAAEAVAAAWAGQHIGEMTVVIPRIELVASGADNSLRCTRPEACRNADAVLAWINGSLAQPALRKVDLSRAFRNNRNIRPGTYEVWFAPGPIALKGGA